MYPGLTLLETNPRVGAYTALLNLAIEPADVVVGAAAVPLALRPTNTENTELP
jgi:hypothetical protein